MTSTLSSSSWKKTAEHRRQREELNRIRGLQDSATSHFEEIATWLSIGYVLFGAILYNTTVTTVQQYYSGGVPTRRISSNRWIPLSLYVSVSVAFWLQLSRSLRRYIEISSQSDISWMHQQRLHDLMFLRLKAGETAADQLVGVGAGAAQRSMRNWRRNQRRVYISAVVSALATYTLAVLYASVSFS